MLNLFQKKISDWALGRKRIALSYSLLGEVPFWSVTELKRNSSNNWIVERAIDNLTLVELLPYLKADVAVGLNIFTAPGLLFRTCEHCPSEEEAIDSILDDVDASDFFSSYSLIEDIGWLSVIRKGEVLSVLDELKVYQIFPLFITVGVSAGLPFLETWLEGTAAHSSVIAHPYTIQFGVDNTIESIGISVEQREFDQETVTSLDDVPLRFKEICAIASAIDGNGDRESGSRDFVNLRLSHTLIVLGIGIISLGFLSGLINYYAAKEISEIQSDIYRKRKSISRLSENTIESKKQSELLVSLGIREQGTCAYYLDQVASVFKGCRLENLIVYPEVKTDVPVLYDNGIIDVSGWTDKVIDVTILVDVLKRKKWIDNVSLIALKLREDGSQYFEITILLSPR